MPRISYGPRLEPAKNGESLSPTRPISAPAGRLGIGRAGLTGEFFSPSGPSLRPPVPQRISPLALRNSCWPRRTSMPVSVQVCRACTMTVRSRWPPGGRPPPLPPPPDQLIVELHARDVTAIDAADGAGRRSHDARRTRSVSSRTLTSVPDTRRPSRITSVSATSGTAATVSSTSKPDRRTRLMVGCPREMIVAVPARSYHWGTGPFGPERGRVHLRRICRLLPCALLVLLVGASPARADLTAFLGAQSNPSTRLTKGVSAGSGFLIVGFEGEYAQASGDDVCAPVVGSAGCAPSVRTIMFNGLVQTPRGILPKIQLYATVGGGYYRIRYRIAGRAGHRIWHQPRRRREDRSGGSPAPSAGLSDLQADRHVRRSRGWTPRRSGSMRGRTSRSRRSGFTGSRVHGFARF